MSNDVCQTCGSDPLWVCNECGEGWRIDATDLHTGIVKAVLQPISVEWEDPYCSPGQGTIRVATQDPSADDIWPHTTGIYVNRVNSDGSRTGVWGGFVDVFDGNGTGETTIGVVGIDGFLNHRLLADADGGLAYSTSGYVDADNPGPGAQQTRIATDLVFLAAPTGSGVNGGNGIHLHPTFEDSTVLRPRHWAATDFKNLGEAIQEMVKDANGLTYSLSHLYVPEPGTWTTIIHFRDEPNIDNGVVLRGDFEGWQYGLDVDAKNQASRIYGVGSGEGDTTMFSVAYDTGASLPEFQSTLAWKDITAPAVLDSQTRGAVSDFRDPASTPSMTLVGLTDVPPDTLSTGDIVSCEMGYGVITYRGQKGRVLSQAWKLAVDEPITRTLSILPIIRPSLSVKTQTPAKEPPPLSPEQFENPPPETPIDPPTTPGTAPDYPSQVLDLSNWKLTLPTPLGGGTPADEIKQPALATYSNAAYFHTVPGPGVLFHAPVNGARTSSNTKYPRCELRETNPSSWSSKTGTHVMEIDQAITVLPGGKNQLVAGQIHDASDDITVCRLEGSVLYATNGDNTHYLVLDNAYVLGTRFVVKMTATSAGIKYEYNGVDKGTVPVKGTGYYFKAGVYPQANASNGSGYGEVIIYALTVTHT